MKQIINLPNFISLLRILVIPIFAIGFLHKSGMGYFLAFITAAIIEISDLLDGYIARHNKQVTKFGKLFDPLADTLSRFSIFLTLLIAGILPPWMIFVFFIRDMSIAYMRAFASTESIIISARYSGKIKAVMQAIAILSVCYLLMLSKQNMFFTNPTHRLGVVITIVVMVTFILLSLWYYKIKGYAKHVLLILTPILTFLMLLAIYIKIQISIESIKKLIYILLFITVTMTAYSLFDYAVGFVKSMSAKNEF